MEEVSKVSIIDEVVFYSKSYKEPIHNNLKHNINLHFPDLKIYTRVINIFSSYDPLPQVDIYEALVILPKNLIKDFYNIFQSSGTFLKNEVPINPLKEI